MIVAFPLGKIFQTFPQIFSVGCWEMHWFSHDVVSILAFRFWSGIFKCLWVTKICENSCMQLTRTAILATALRLWFLFQKKSSRTKSWEKRKDVTANHQLLELKSFKQLSNLVEKIVVKLSLVHVILPALLIFSPKKNVRWWQKCPNARDFFFLNKLRNPIFPTKTEEKST